MTEPDITSEGYLVKVKRYLKEQCWDDMEMMRDRHFTVSPLACGEYNLNYLLEEKERKLVFRVNIGTQINRDDQIEYEYKTLSLLQNSGVTPVPYFVDDSRALIDKGILLMEYLPGRPLDYRKDLAGAAKTFATVHQTKISNGRNHLIVEQQPLSLIYNECAGLLDKFFQSDLADPGLRRFLEKLLHWAERVKKTETFFLDAPWLCIVNTEVNSGNFIINAANDTTHLIDWEMARWGDPSTDLCHFCSPLTTLWKSNYRMSEDDRSTFLKEYCRNITSLHLCQTLKDRMRLKMPFVMLRGISWSAMGWAAYQSDYQGIRNKDTWKKLNQYMELDFIRQLFHPFMQG
ncbi:MAG: phosphotransferase family protein [Desulforhopalus sp.]